MTRKTTFTCDACGNEYTQLQDFQVIFNSPILKALGADPEVYDACSPTCLLRIADAIKTQCDKVNDPHIIR